MFIAALLLGIVSLVVSVIGFFLLWPLMLVSLAMSITGIVLGAIAKQKQCKGMSGLILNIISTTFSCTSLIIMLVLLIMGVSMM